MVTKTYNILNTIQAVHADVVLANHFLSINGGASFDFRKADSGVARIGVAGTAAVWTVTFTAAVATYTLVISQPNPDNGTIITETLNYTATAADTATTIGNAFRTMIGLTNLKIAATGTTTLILTANAGYEMFTVTNIQPATTSVVNGTPGVPQRGTVLALTRTGIASSELTAGGLYSAYTFVYQADSRATAGGNVEVSRNMHTLYALESATNYAALDAYIDEVIQAFVAGGTTSDPEALAIG